MNISECYEKGLIKKTFADSNLIKSLVEMSDIKEKIVKEAKLDERTVSAFVSIAYDSLREALEAVCISKGYKVFSHICIGELLRDIVDDFDYNEFDRMRYVRNGINYYGTKVEIDEGREIIRKIFGMRRHAKIRLKQFL